MRFYTVSQNIIQTIQSTPLFLGLNKLFLIYNFKHFKFDKPLFLRVCNTSVLRVSEKEKLLVTSNFSFSHSVFNPFVELYVSFIKYEIVVCKLFRFGSTFLSFDLISHTVCICAD